MKLLRDGSSLRGVTVLAQHNVTSGVSGQPKTQTFGKSGPAPHEMAICQNSQCSCPDFAN